MRSGIAGIILALCSSLLTMIALDELGYLNHGDSPVVVVDPDTPPVTSLKDHKLVVIRSKSSQNTDNPATPLNEAVEYTKTMDDYDFWETYCSATFDDAEVLDTTDEYAAAFLAAHNLTPPIVILVSPNKDVVWTMPLPMGGTQAIRDKIDGK